MLETVQGYKIVFDDALLSTDFGTALDNKEMEIDFLGKKIVIAAALDATAASETPAAPEEPSV